MSFEPADFNFVTANIHISSFYTFMCTSIHQTPLNLQTLHFNFWSFNRQQIFFGLWVLCSLHKYHMWDIWAVTQIADKSYWSLKTSKSSLLTGKILIKPIHFALTSIMIPTFNNNKNVQFDYPQWLISTLQLVKNNIPVLIKYILQSGEIWFAIETNAYNSIISTICSEQAPTAGAQ